MDSSDTLTTEQAIMLTIVRQQGALSEALARPWIDGLPNVRTWHAVYYIHVLDETRCAVVYQVRNAYGFQVGVIRDCADGPPIELRSFVVTTLEAVVFLGLHYLEHTPAWQAAL